MLSTGLVKVAPVELVTTPTVPRRRSPRTMFREYVSFTFNAGAAPALNVNETYSLNIVRGDRRLGTVGVVTNSTGATFTKPVDNIGDKTFGGPTGYAAYANQYIYNITIPGCSTQGRVFVGQRKESFYIAVGRIFDLFNMNPLGPEVGGNNNDLEAKNVSTLALELPISCVTAGTD